MASTEHILGLLSLERLRLRVRDLEAEVYRLQTLVNDYERQEKEDVQALRVHQRSIDDEGYEHSA